MSSDLPEVLFLCNHNAGRSQMAAAFLRQIGGRRVIVHSAGSEPAEDLNPAVVASLAEVGLDISGERPKLLVDEMAQTADVVVTMGCGDACPVYPGKRYLDWELPDPAGKPIEEVRPIRDEIERRVTALVAELLAGNPSVASDGALVGIMSSSKGFLCRLDERDRSEQAERWRDQRAFVVSSVRSENGFRVTFDPACRDDLVALVAIERVCCDWADWSLTTATEVIILEVTGPAREIEALAEAFGL
jgi:protein-tyrosine-phosphatase